MGEAVSDPTDTVNVTEIVLTTPLLVTVIVALLGPTVVADKATLAAMDPLPLPDDGLKVSQVALLLAVQLPFELTVRVWLAGLTPPCTPENVKDNGLSATVVAEGFGTPGDGRGMGGGASAFGPGISDTTLCKRGVVGRPCI